MSNTCKKCKTRTIAGRKFCTICTLEEAATLQWFAERLQRQMFEQVTYTQEDIKRMNSAMTLFPTAALKYKFLGCVFGYPPCCVDSFIEGKRKARDAGDFMGSGFTPCTHCQQTRTTQELVDKVNKARLLNTPFTLKKKG